MRFPKPEEYPKTLRVKTRTWRVEFTDQPIIYDGRDDNRGLSDPEDRVITLDANRTPRIILQTFVHECFHAIEMEYEIKFPHALIYALEKPVTKFIVDNFFPRRRNP